MNIKYICSFCDTPYDWYSGIYENPGWTELDDKEKRKIEKAGGTYEKTPGIFIEANAFRLYVIEPDDDRKTPTIREVRQPRNNLDTYMNICPVCMRKLLDNLKIDSESAWDMA